MKWIIITTPTFISHEAKYIDQLFEAGIDLLHLRKPDSTPEECEQLLQKIDPKWYPQIVIHDHFELCEKYHLHGIHLNRRNSQIPENFQGSISRSCHSFEEVTESLDNTNPDFPKGPKPTFDYVFLSPIFDSISKMGDGVHLDFRRMLAEVFPLRKFLRHLISLLTNRPEGSVVPSGLLYVLRKLRSSLGMFCTHSPADSICTT